MVPTRGGMPRFAPSRCGVAVGAHIPPGGGITSGVVPKRTRVAGFPQLLVAALLAAECSEPVGPERHAPVAADVTPAATGIALDQLNGGVGQSGNVFIKGFNPTNPHLGDAIVATFFWLGSTNIIDSVTDVLTTTPYTPVGNTYTLVEYVTAGGISMATYVATNVQNFPYPNTSDAQVLAVRANLSQSVTDGMELLSAWSGVGGVSTAHRSATGSGSSYPTTADPGPITLGAGDLAYAVTMSNGLVGRDPPPAPFATLAVQSDANLVDEADYAVLASGGSVDPQWNWIFNSPSTWLATVLALNPASPPATQLAFTVQPSDALVNGTISPAVQVTALDAAGNPVPSFTGSITIALGTNSTGATLSGTTSVAAVNGVATFSDLSIDRIGTYTLQATASGLTSAASAAVNITARLAFTVQPSNALVNGTISPALQVAALDANGNPVPSFTGTIAVALGTNSTGATLSGTTSVAAVNGVATFSDLSIDRIGTYRLLATASGLTSATSAAVSITARLAFTVQPSTTLPTMTIKPAVQVTALDAHGRPVASFGGFVTIAIGRNGGLLMPGTLSGTKTVLAAGGVATFADLSIDQLGNGYTLVATAYPLILAQSAPFNIGGF